MIKSIGNSESINSSFDNLLSNMNNRDLTIEVSKQDNKVEKEKSDEFLKSFDSEKIEAEITKLLEDESLESKFSTDEDTDKLILKIIDKETDEVVRQYPSEETLKIVRIVIIMIENNSLNDARIW